TSLYTVLFAGRKQFWLIRSLHLLTFLFHTQTVLNNFSNLSNTKGSARELRIM
ncbi:hypothetical protein L9F63_005791, partial [Diploptera punctata]